MAVYSFYIFDRHSKFIPHDRSTHHQSARHPPEIYLYCWTYIKQALLLVLMRPRQMFLLTFSVVLI